LGAGVTTTKRARGEKGDRTSWLQDTRRDTRRAQGETAEGGEKPVQTDGVWNRWGKMNLKKKNKNNTAKSWVGVEKRAVSVVRENRNCAKYLLHQRGGTGEQGKRTHREDTSGESGKNASWLKSRKRGVKRVAILQWLKITG